MDETYLDEFVFRFNRRGNLQAAFQRLREIAARGEGATGKSLYGGAGSPPDPQSAGGGKR